MQRYAQEYGRAKARIESGIILFCRLASSRQQALDEMAPFVRRFGAGAEQFLECSALGTPEEIRERIQAYIDVGLNKFVWPHLRDPTNIPARSR